MSGGIKWLTEEDRVMAAAKGTGRAIMVDFSKPT